MKTMAKFQIEQDICNDFRHFFHPCLNGNVYSSGVASIFPLGGGYYSFTGGGAIFRNKTIYIYITFLLK